MNTSNIILSESSPSSFHTNMAKATMPEHRIKFEPWKRKIRRKRLSNRNMSRKSRRRYCRKTTKEVKLQERKMIGNLGSKFESRKYRVPIRKENFRNPARREQTRHPTLDKCTNR